MAFRQRGLFWRSPQKNGEALDTKANGVQDQRRQPITLRRRLKHFTWAWFTLPMSTGGLALLLSSTPHRFDGLTTIGKIVFIFDIAVFLALCAAISTRFILYPGSLTLSLKHPTEALFFPAFWLAVVNILSCSQAYGGPASGSWLHVALRVLFWIYLAATFLVAVFQYWALFRAPPSRLTIQSMTPAWLLPIFPLMLCGTLSSTLVASQPPVQRLPIIVAGIAAQGIGWTVSCLMYALYLHRLIQFGLPAPNLRPGMFIAVGPPSFTGLALIGISNALPADYAYFAEHPGSIMVLQTMADFIAIFLWLIAFWFFCISVLSVLTGVRKMTFHLVWWAMVFPNVGFTISTIMIGKQLRSEGILWVASAMTILLVAIWLFVLIAHARAVVTKRMMMPGMDEDKDEYKEDDRKHDIPVPP